MLPEMFTLLLKYFLDEQAIHNFYVQGDEIRAAIAMTALRQTNNYRRMDLKLVGVDIPTNPMEMFDHFYPLSEARTDLPFYGLLATLLTEFCDPERLYRLLSVGRRYLTPFSMRLLFHKYSQVSRLQSWFPQRARLPLRASHERYLRSGVLRLYQYREKMVPSERLADLLLHGGHSGSLPLNWSFDRSIVHTWRWPRVVEVVAYWPYLLAENERMDLAWLFGNEEMDWKTFLNRISSIEGPQVAMEVHVVLSNLRIPEHFSLREVRRLVDMNPINCETTMDDGERAGW
ncbi:hypothetical protein PSACC_02015 [Paramicrosporidium saccamoebae]|uniref:Uncharacterized protein n=1 Tax=Paramicrosporidium saccamoebae TaxID=1246581 RepID=A0A2H9TKB1_9FUNG|nr:hypothetical protein PSACC_02015 [Paramicrosporidium saccamoebae]